LSFHGGCRRTRPHHRTDPAPGVDHPSAPRAGTERARRGSTEPRRAKLLAQAHRIRQRRVRETRSADLTKL
jgi:hypothetical protein